MPRPAIEQVTVITDFSPGVMRKSTKFMKLKPPQAESSDANNARFFRTGGISKAPGYLQKGDDLPTSTTSSTTSTTTSTSTSTSSSSSSTSSSSTTTMA